MLTAYVAHFTPLIDNVWKGKKYDFEEDWTNLPPVIFNAIQFNFFNTGGGG